MRKVALLVLALALSVSAEWVYRTFLRPVDQPTQQMIALAEYFNANGLKGHIYPVQHGYMHSELTAAAAFQIDGYPLPVAIDQCPDESSASTLLHATQASPNLMHATRNGLLVMNLPMWGDDTDTMVEKVVGLFSSFQPERADPP
jgi:hypothetical protein